ncbi:MAG: cupredoxin domain-containing protein [Actinomycetota bacterium]
MHPNRAGLRLVAGAAAALLLLAACGGGEEDGGGGAAGGGGGGGQAEELEVTIENFQFKPSDLSVPAGAEVTVTVTNEDQDPHTFTAEDDSFDSGNIDGGKSKEVTLTAPDADVGFVCSYHDSMTGTVTVEG